MDDPTRDLESKALRLSPKERARLAERLISSLDQASEGDTEPLWLEEAERRLDELESGEVAPLPAEAALKKARSTLR